jgi:bacterioferritin-associated ferredoxin
MALKLFCSNCTELIKEITPDEASRLPEEVICKKCRDKARNVLDELNAVYKKEVQKMANYHNKSVLKLETIVRTFIDDL